MEGNKGKKAIEFNSSVACTNDRFQNDMLVQILCYLPFECAVRCKLVCKLWLSLISSHGFAIRFVSRHDRHHQQQSYNVLKGEGCYFLLTSEISKFNISFSFLPEISTTSKYEIVASCDDMLLFRSESDDDDTIDSSYIICNPFTKGWAKLPPPPPCSNGQYCLGFTCEPYCKVKGEKVVNSSCRFRVVRLKVGRKLVAEPAFAFKMDIFSSETWQWTTTMMHSPLKVQPIRSTSRNGLLYWMCFFGEVVVHDPFNNTNCYAIHPPPRPGLSRWNFRFSISEGCLLAFQGPITWDLAVWELEDWDQRNWRLKTVVALKDHVLNTSEMLEWVDGALTTLAFDPSDKNVLFLYTSTKGIATINLKTRVFKSTFSPKLFQQCYYFPTYICIGDEPPVFEIKAPCCPNPISAFFNKPPPEPTNEDY